MCLKKFTSALPAQTLFVTCNITIIAHLEQLSRTHPKLATAQQTTCSQSSAEHVTDLHLQVWKPVKHLPGTLPHALPILFTRIGEEKQTILNLLSAQKLNAGNAAHCHHPIRKVALQRDIQASFKWQVVTCRARMRMICEATRETEVVVENLQTLKQHSILT